MSEAENAFLYGMLAAGLSIIGFGFYPVPLRLKRVRDSNVSPMVLHIYVGTSAALVSILTLTFTPFVWTWWGVLGAAMWAVIQGLFFTSIPLLGLTTTPPIVCGLTITVSFFWGYAFFEEPVKSLAFSLMALGVMMIGIACITLTGAGYPAKLMAKVQEMRKTKYTQLADVELSHTALSEPSTSMMASTDTLAGGAAEQTTSTEAPRSKRDIVMGIGCAALAGVINGSMMVPVSLFIREESPNFPGVFMAPSFLFSFGVGVFMTTPLVAGAYFLAKREKPDFHFKATVLPSLVSGVLWGVSNIAAVYAVGFLGNVLGFPLTQLNIVVAGIIGIVYFKEIRGVAIAFFAFSTLVLLSGVGVLAYFGGP